MENTYINSLLKKIYNLDIKEFRAMYDLKDGSESQQLDKLFKRQNSIFLGVSKNVNDRLTKLDNLTVVGGPCICYCGANIDKVSLQEIIDIIYPMFVAKKLNKPCIIYLQVHEAFMQQIAIFGEKTLYSEWENVRLSLERMIKRLGNRIGFPDEKLYIISTDIENIKKELDLQCDKLKARKAIGVDKLDGLYSINGKSEHPKNSSLKDVFYEVYERNLAVYLPEFVSRAVGWNVENILVVENSTQLKAIRMAETISEQYMGARHGIYIASFLSTPGISGQEMSQSFSKDKLFINEGDLNVKSLYKRIDENITWYYKYCIPKEFSGYENMKFEELLAFLKSMKQLA